MAGMGEMQVPVRAVSAVSSDVPLEVNAVGNVEAVASVEVKSRVAGQVLRVNFGEGQDIKAGQLLFEIDGEPLRRQIAELEANIAKDEAQEKQFRANVIRDEAQLKQVRTAADRAVSLAKDGIFSKEQTEQSVATADTAQAALDADRAAVEGALAASKADHARLEGTKLQLSYTQITAPISGRAGAISIKAGNLVKDNDATLVTILQMSPIYVSFGVPEQFLPQVRQYNGERRLQVEASAADQRSEIGKLEFIDSSVDAATGTIKLKAVFPNRGRQLWPGQFVNVKARLNLEHGRIVVPSRTLQTGPQGKYVWVMNPSDHSVAMRPVDVLRLYQGPKNLEEAVVGKGLSAGEMVISEGQMRLMPGAKVRLLQSDSQLSDAAGASAAGGL
ncbi:MAG: efflux transporter periplasmic adaptor subunit [Bryobacterales bacterium]|jgi:membrane fusion protein, multidrug efflux system|nr:efflux transporter periplasmic adaptor subunit [Bryobacterales bacterium]